NETVISIDPVEHIVRTGKSLYRAEYLILASGSEPNQIPELGDSLRLLAPWFSTTAQADLFRNKDVLVIGGGDRAVESAYNIAAYARRIYLAVRSGHFRARSEWVKRLQHCANVAVYLHSQVTT
ncbi:NAD(P)/FAD-dependent oxidoreductase, partial [Microbacteriaceae bacterium K1510]|nr:NAD(P)/FAD-dependent oxidoreductase [Microbacteriaceae bacterium K1510]